MNSARTLLLGLAMVFTLVAVGYAADDEKTLKGTITCAKCGLKKADKCNTVIQVKEGDKEVIYWFAEAKGKEHKDICQDSKKGTVVGTVKKEGDKMVIKTKSVKFD
jgi:hypothetical protein